MFQIIYYILFTLVLFCLFIHNNFLFIFLFFVLLIIAIIFFNIFLLFSIYFINFIRQVTNK